MQSPQREWFRLSAIDPQYSQVPLSYGAIYHVIAYGTAMTVAESEPDFRIISDTPFLALLGELWGVYCVDLGENWPF